MMHSSSPGSKQALTALILITTLLVILMYGRFLTMPLYADDYRWLTWSDQLLHDPLTLFSLDAAVWRFACKLYYVVLYLMFGLAPLGYHVGDLLLYICHFIFLALILQRLRYPFVVTAIAVPVMALHSAHPGALLICGSATGMLGIFCGLLTILLHLRWRETGQAGYRYAALACFIIGLMGKEVIVTFPALLVLIDLVFFADRNRSNWQQLLRQHAPFWAAAVIFLAFIAFVQTQAHSGVVSVKEKTYALSYIKTNYSRAVLSLFVPSWKNISLKYKDLIPHIILLLSFICSTKRTRFWIAWIYVTYLPFSLIAWGYEPRFLYLASMGFAVITGIFVHHLTAIMGAGKRQAFVLQTAILAALISFYFIDLSASGRTEPYVREADKADRFIAAVRRTPDNPLYLLDTGANVKFIDPYFINIAVFGGERTIIKTDAPEHHGAPLLYFNGRDFLTVEQAG